MKIFIPYEANADGRGHAEPMGYFESLQGAINEIKEAIAKRDDKEDIRELDWNKWGYSKHSIFYWIVEAKVQP